MYTQEQVAAAKHANALIDALPNPRGMTLSEAITMVQSVGAAMQTCRESGLVMVEDVDAACAQTDGPCSGEQ